jgi:L-arabinonolactonase
MTAAADGPAAVCVVDCRNILGEVPVWDAAEQALYWVDIEGCRLQRLIPATGDRRPARLASA